MGEPSDGKRAGEVLSSLPSTRPQRRSARRSKPEGSRARPSAAARPSSPRPAARKPRAKAAKQAAGGRPAAVRPSVATKRAREPGPRPRSNAAHKPPAQPEGLELVTTAVQAAGELAQLGLTVGVRALRGAVSRLPRP